MSKWTIRRIALVVLVAAPMIYHSYQKVSAESGFVQRYLYPLLSPFVIFFISSIVALALSALIAVCYHYYRVLAGFFTEKIQRPTMEKSMELFYNVFDGVFVIVFVVAYYMEITGTQFYYRFY